MYRHCSGCLGTGPFLAGWGGTCPRCPPPPPPPPPGSYAYVMMIGHRLPCLEIEREDLSDSDLDTSISFTDHINTSASKRLKLGGSPSPSKVDNIPIPSTAAEVGRLAAPVIDRVVVSPSLLVSSHSVSFLPPPQIMHS